MKKYVLFTKAATQVLFQNGKVNFTLNRVILFRNKHEIKQSVVINKRQQIYN
jgi:hypothetical protein